MTRTLLVLLVLGVMAPPATAQSRGAPARPPAPRRVELGIGGGMAGGLSLGTRDAELLSNNTSGSPFRLFSTDARLAPAPIIEGRLGYRVTPRLTLEAAVTVGWPELTTSLSDDAESAPDVDATESLTARAPATRSQRRAPGTAGRSDPQHVSSQQLDVPTQIIRNES